MSDITYSVLHNAEKLTVENFDISATQVFRQYFIPSPVIVVVVVVY